MNLVYFPTYSIYYQSLTKKRVAQLNYFLVSDLNQTIIKHYQILTDNEFPFSALFIVDKDVIIQYYTVNNLLCRLSINELLWILRSIQYIKENLGHERNVKKKFEKKILYSHTIKSKVYFKKLKKKKKN